MCLVTSVQGNRLQSPDSRQTDSIPICISHICFKQATARSRRSRLPWFCRLVWTSCRWRWPLPLPSGHHPPRSLSLICWSAANSAVPPWRADWSAAWVLPCCWRLAWFWSPPPRSAIVCVHPNSRAHCPEVWSSILLSFSSSIFSSGNYYGHA
jgi:hypothetical protein